MVGTVVKSKVCDLEKEIREVFFEEVEEGDDWCGAGGCWEEEVFCEVPGWVG